MKIEWFAIPEMNVYWVANKAHAMYLLMHKFRNTTN